MKNNIQRVISYIWRTRFIL